MRKCLLLLLLAGLCLEATETASATSYVMVDDGVLADQATAIVAVRVEAVEPAATATRPATDYTVEVERLLGGSVPGTTLVVRVPGGLRRDGVGFRLHGAPRFAPGARALLFLVPGRSGTFGILHLALGAFHRVEAAGEALALRDLSDLAEVVLPGNEADSRRHAPRDFNAFADWLADRSAGIEGPADYFLEDAPDRGPSLLPKFTLTEVGGLNLRWFEFDDGAWVTWLAHSAGQPSVPEGGFAEFEAALEAWSAEACTPVDLDDGGTTTADAGLQSFDGLNVLLQDDPNDEISGTFQCGTGGIRAIGGPWFIQSQRGTFEGQEYIRILGADVVMNDGIECLAATSPCFPTYIEGVYGHELGHALGIGHSCGDSSSPPCSSEPVLADALMRAFAHQDCRGARLGSDDQEALWSLYDDGSACTGDLTLELTDHTVTTAETFEACRTLTAGADFVVGSAGDVDFRAGELIVLSDGFSVEAGGGFTAGLDPALRCR